MLSLAEVRAGPHQPRQEFDEGRLAELARSIGESGILQPIIVRSAGVGYEIVVGERRGSPVGRILQSGKEGMIALARNDSDASAQVAAPLVVEAGRRAMKFFDPDCDAPFCDCAYIRDLLAPLAAGTKTTAIYSSEDQVVSPDACVMHGATNIEVTGTHSGLVFNKAVYPHIAAALAI